MPGLNQLKKFTDDMQNIGEEVKIRLQRGEKPAVVPLPEGISEEDDSDDFVLGLPSSDAKEEPQNEDASSYDIPLPDGIDLPPETSQTPDLDALFGSQSSDGDQPDLSEFLDTPEEPPAPEPEETPLEDLDLDALLKSAAESQDKIPEDEAFETPDISSPLEEIKADAPSLDDFAGFADVVDDTQTENAAEPENIEPPETASQPAADAEPENDDEFAFDGDAIDLNADVPDEISEQDGSMPEDDFELDPALEAQAPDDDSVIETNNSQSGQPDTAESLPDFEDETQPADEAAVETAEESAQSAAPEESSETEQTDIPSFSADDFNIPDLDFNSAPSATDEESENDTAAQAILNSGTFPVDAADDVPAEDFSSEAQDLGSADIDFGTPASSVEDEFQPTQAGSKAPEDDFLLEDEEFNIPGFSDTQTAAFDKRGRPKVDVVDFSKAGGKPKNTLTDEEYEKFRKNLSDYPLNLRLAVEDLIVKNEFTDDAVFEVVEKILKKTPARQLATHLEKMLDIAIDVPRDYERRSVAQYEAYKQSFQYQLKNRIIPGTVAATAIAVVCALLFQAGVMFIYKPAMAKIFYKQGLTLIENNEYPQSDAKFAEAVQYKPIKKWFFKFADAYRKHKQFERAGRMYRNTLAFFNHDKQAGLEWAEMELYDRANYEQAENIIKREVLDYHINDSDALLLLGDVFLEWGETDGSKYELAKNIYRDLVQTSKSVEETDTYLSRMLRYYIRTDKLRNVIELKQRFFPREKSLSAGDWTELSGYLLNKLYGELPRADEYLRANIEDVKAMLDIAEKLDSANPSAHYNSARYYEHNSNFELARRELQTSLDCFDKLEVRTKKTVYQEIDACRLLGELFADVRQYIKAQEIYTRGITLFQNENERTGFEGDRNTGILYSDMGDIEYFISGDMEAALKNYEQAALNKYATPGVNYRIGAINYNLQNYETALTFFIKAFENEDKDVNLLLALGNVQALRGDNNASLGSYKQLISILDEEKVHREILFPQKKEDDNRIVEMYLKANNNLGVVLYKLSRQTGNSQKNGESFERFAESIRAWDALTRNQETMIRLGGSNLALQNSKYLTAFRSDFEPAIYTEISKTLTGDKVLE